MSIELTYRCGVCRCYLEAEDLFCANCGTENPHADDSAKKLENTPTHHSFGCKACGAAMSYDASAQALRCPFCASTDMEPRENSRGVKASRVVPLRVTKQEAENLLRDWLGSGFWRPKDAARAAQIGEIAAVYVPYWSFSARTNTQWTADSSPAPRGSKGDWYPVSGNNNATYSDILIGGSSVLTPQETQALSPFRIGDAVAPDSIDLENAIVEEFRVSRKVARPQAREMLETLEQSACAKLVPNRHRNLRTNVRVSAMEGRPTLLPVWILAYRYKNAVHRVLINGQTGTLSGSAPFSYGKLTTILIIAAVVIACLFAIGALTSAF